jgi:amidase
MKGARIGVPSDPGDPLNDCYYGKLPPMWSKVIADAFKVLEDLGAVIVRANMPTLGWIGGPGTTMAVLNRNPLSRHKGNPATPPIVFLYARRRSTHRVPSVSGHELRSRRHRSALPALSRYGV